MVRRLGGVVAVLTLGQLFVWDSQDAHRSMFGFVMSMIWLEWRAWTYERDRQNEE